MASLPDLPLSSSEFHSKFLLPCLFSTRFHPQGLMSIAVMFILGPRKPFYLCIKSFWFIPMWSSYFKALHLKSWNLLTHLKWIIVLVCTIRESKQFAPNYLWSEKLKSLLALISGWLWNWMSYSVESRIHVVLDTFKDMNFHLGRGPLHRRRQTMESWPFVKAWAFNKFAMDSRYITYCILEPSISSL